MSTSSRSSLLTNYLLSNTAANLVLAGLTPTEKEDKYKIGRLTLNVFSL